MTEAQVVELLALTNQKYNLFNRLLQDRPIHIILADNTCGHADSLYYYNANRRALLKDLIVLTHVVDEQVQPEFAFLHEIGHMVHTRITKKSFVPPRSFKALHEIIFRHIGASPIDQAKMPPKWFAEWFAECFAIATIHKSEYASLNYHTSMEATDIDAISHYMDKLFASLR